ncbi:unnamed protein product [Owenia fusiformis]|uniref:Uncharacterized protein n=1 Tax=Owenia fusiformis TaxID=6347 RepID=A0A8J1T644_OWEFU|nr:unnamed protein product [Owenia fusiformis]
MSYNDGGSSSSNGSGNEPIFMLTTEQLTTLSYIDIATASLSVLGAGSILASVCWTRTCCLPEVTPIFHLSLADLLASLCLLVGAALYATNYHGFYMFCHYLTGFTSAFYICTFLLTLTYGVEVYIRMRDRLIRKEKTCRVGKCQLVYVFYIVAWGLPLLVAGTLSLITQYKKSDLLPVIPKNYDCSSCLPLFHYNDNVCWTENNKTYHIAAKYLFLGPMIFIIITNAIVYYLAFRAFQGSLLNQGLLGYTQRQEQYAVRNKSILYQLAFFFCWLPSLILGCVALYSKFDPKCVYWLYIVQACTSPLQGFLNSVIYGWKRDGFTRVITENTALLGGSTNRQNNDNITSSL